MISMVKKFQKLTSKKVQLILTDKPKVIYVDPAKLEVRGNIIWSDNPNELSVQIISPSNFKIVTVSFISSLQCYTVDSSINALFVMYTFTRKKSCLVGLLVASSTTSQLLYSFLGIDNTIDRNKTHFKIKQNNVASDLLLVQEVAHNASLLFNTFDSPCVIYFVHITSNTKGGFSSLNPSIHGRCLYRHVFNLHFQGCTNYVQRKTRNWVEEQRPDSVA